MTKTELVAEVALKAGLSKKDADKAVAAVFETIACAMKEDKVSIVGFGAFSSKVRPAREAKNPSTGETVLVPEKKVPVFSAGKGLKDKIAE